MKPKLRRILALTAVLLPFGSAAHAATLTWNGAPGGSWNETELNWRDGLFPAAWISEPPDSAVFGAVGAGTVNADADIVAAGLTFDANYTLAGGPLQLAGPAEVTVNADSAISAAIGGTNGLVKLGSGTLTLTGTNTYSGDTQVNSGALRLGNGLVQPTLQSNYAIGAGALVRVQYNSSGLPAAWTATQWGKFTGSGTLALTSGKNADSNWAPTAPALPAAFTGTLQIEKGRVATALAGDHGLGGTSSVTVLAGGQLGMWNGGTYTQAFTVAGTGYGELGFEAALRLGNVGLITTLIGNVTLAGNTTLGASGTGVLTGTLNESAASNLTIGTAQMAGTIVLAGPASYTGTTTVNNGTLRFATPQSLYGGNTAQWTAAKLTVKSGTTAAFQVGGPGEFTPADINLIRTLGSATGGFLSGSTLGIDTSQATAPVVLAANLTNPNAGANALGLTKIGAGTLVLTGNNTYTGKTTVNAGTLRLAGPSALYGGTTSSWNTTNLVFNAGGTTAFHVGGSGEFSAAQIDTLKGLGGTTGGFKTGSFLGLDTTNAPGGTFSYASAIANPSAAVIGLVKLGSGTLNLTGASTFTGSTTVESGALTMTGAAGSSGGGTLLVGGATGRATLVLNASGTLNYGTASSTNGPRVGGNDGAGDTGVGAIEQLSGTVTYGRSGTFLELGAGGPATYGSYVLTGGTLTTSTAQAGIRVGSGGTGVFTQTGGTLNCNRWFAVGSSSVGATTSTGVATLTGGTATVNTSYRILLGDRPGSSGTFNLGTLAGGTASVTHANTTGLTLLGDAGALAATCNLNSGTMVLGGPIYRNGTTAGSSAVVNLNGATLRASSNIGLITASPSLPVHVFNGGVTVDTQAFNANIGASLLAPTGRGMYPAGGGFALAANRGSGYLGAPLVTVTSSGAGSGATAIATVANGEVTGVILTSPGQGYQAGDAVSFTFSGGAPVTPAATFVRTLTAADVASNGSGGLTKLGSGTLTLHGTNTYGGNTTVSAGTLVVSPSGSLSQSAVAVAGGAGLQLSSPGGTLRGLTIENGAVLSLPAGAAPTTVTGALQLSGTPSFSVRPVFFGPPQLGTYQLLLPSSVSGTAGAVTADFSALGTTRVNGTAALSGGKLVLSITSPAADLRWTNAAGTGKWNLNADANFSGADPGTFLNLDSVTFDDAGAGTGTVTLEGALSAALVTVAADVDYTFAGTGTIAGGADLTKSGAGTLFLGASHSYGGTTTIRGGTISVTSLAANGVNSGIGSGKALVLDGGTLRYTGTAAVGSDAGPKFDRSIQVGPNGGALDVAGSNLIFASSPFSGSGPLTVLDTSGDANNRQLLYSGDSPGFSGVVEIGNGNPASGWLQIRSNAATPLGSATVVINSGGALTADNGATNPAVLANPIVLNGGFLGTQTPTMTYLGPVTVNGSTQSSVGWINNGSGDVILVGNLTGSGTVSAVGGKGVKLGGNNTAFNGTWQSASATTWFTAANAGSAAATWIASGGNFTGALSADGTIHLGELSGTAGIVRNDTAASTCVFSVGALGTDATFNGTLTDKPGDATAVTGLTKVGSGKLLVTGTASYTGPTQVLAGHLQLPAVANPATTMQSCTVATGASLAVGGAADGTLQVGSLTLGSTAGTSLRLLNLTPTATRARLAATQSLSVRGTVTLALEGDFFNPGTIPLLAYPASATVNPALFQTVLPRGVDATLVNNTANRTLDLRVDAYNRLTWRGGKSTSWDIDSTANWTFSGSEEKYLDGDQVLLNDTALSTTISLETIVSPGGVVFDNESKELVLTGIGGIDGDGGLLKTNAGTAVIATDNTFAGATTVQGGVLRFGDGTRDGSIAGPLVNHAAVVFHTVGSRTYSGEISGTGSNLTKSGPGTLVLTGAKNTFGGTHAVEAGTLQIGDGTLAGALGAAYQIAPEARVRLHYPAAVRVTSDTPFTARFKGGGTVELDSSQAATGLADWGANLPAPAASAFHPEFTGTFQLSKGRFDSPGTGMGGVSKIVVRDGAQFMTWSGDFPMATEIAGMGWGEVGGATGYRGALRTAAGQTATWSGPVNLVADSGIMAQTGSTVTVSGHIRGPHQLELFIGGPDGEGATMTVAPAGDERNAYGSTRIHGTGTNTGGVIAGNANAFSTGALDMGNSLLRLNGFDFTFARLTGTAGRIVNSSESTPSLLTVGTDGADSSCAAVLADGGTAPLAFTKVGNGTLTLTGVNLHTGATTVTGGTLRIGDGTVNGGLAGPLVTHATAVFANATEQTYAGAISGTGSLTKQGAGTLILTGALSHNGHTTVSSGSLRIQSATLSDTGTVTIATGAVLDLDTASATDRVGRLVLGATTVPSGTYGKDHPTYGAFFSGTGKLTVVSAGYDSWASDPLNGLTAGANDSPGADPDNDGVKNLLEFYLNSHPMKADRRNLPAASLDAGFLRLTFTRRDDAETDVATQMVQFSNGLGAWTNVPLGAANATDPATGVVIEVVENGDSADSITVKIPRTHELNRKLFGRIAITR